MILAYLALAWLLGIAAASFTGAEPAATLAAAGMLGVASFALRPRWSTLTLVAAGFALVFAAGWRYESTVPQPSPTARFNDGDAVRLRAVVSDEPDEQGSSRRYRLSVREAFTNGRWRPDSGGILVRAPLFPQYEYGDLLEIRVNSNPHPRSTTSITATTSSAAASIRSSSTRRSACLTTATATGSAQP